MELVEDCETYESMCELREKGVVVDCEVVARTTRPSMSLAPAITRCTHATPL